MQGASAARSTRREKRNQAMSKLRWQRFDRSAAVQSDVRDACRGRDRRKLHRISTTGNSTIDLRTVQKRSRSVAQKTPVRHCANRQGFPKRNQSSQFHFSLARVRADGTRILLPGGAGNGIARILEGRAPEVL